MQQVRILVKHDMEGEIERSQSESQRWRRRDEVFDQRTAFEPGICVEQVRLNAVGREQLRSAL